MVPKERFELSWAIAHYALNVARLPFRHFGLVELRGFEPLTPTLPVSRSTN